MSIVIYYHPSVTIKQNQLKESSFNWIVSRNPIESFAVSLNNKDENLQHLPDDIFYNISEKYFLNIEKDGSFRNDKCLNFIRESNFEKQSMSIFFSDPFPETPFTKDDSKRLQVIALGEEFELPTKHTIQSPLNKLNKAIFISTFFEYAMPKQTITEDIIKKHLMKF